MCGITGIRQFGRPLERDELEKFTRALAHRGPDGEGFFLDDQVGLGHARLAILDLSESGKCPMHYRSPAGVDLWITFNGEVFNFLELRQELQAKGHTFRSESDTEVVVAAYAEWGERCQSRFNGMWAFAIWNPRDKILFVSRDRFGIKPLYYQVTERFVFASELKCFLTLFGFSPSVNSDVVPTLLEYYRYDGRTDETIMQGVRSLPGGCSITVNDSGEVRIRRWWETMDHLQQLPKRYEDQVEQFRALFIDAVRLRLRADVPVGTCLSGGIDSSAVASGMAYLHKTSNDLERCSGSWRKAFVAQFPGALNDETRYAKLVADEVGAEAFYWKFDQDEALEHLLDSQYALDEPSGGYAVPVWCLYRELRRNKVIVSLDGHGGDELLGGYGWYLDWARKDFNTNLYLDFHATLLPTILRNYDRSSMAHGIEVRMPLMDYRLVTYAFGLQPEAKIGGGFTKRILRDALKGILPEPIRIRRQKIGFNVPLIDWFNGGLAPLLEKIVQHRCWRESPFFDSAAVGDTILRRTRARAWQLADWDAAFRASTMINLVLWEILFVDKSRGALQ